MKHEGSIDFVCVTYAMRLPHMRPYIKNLVESIHKYVTGIDYKIYLVYNYLSDNFDVKLGDGKNELEVLSEMFGDDEKITLVKGIDQSKTTEIRSDKIKGEEGKFGQWGGPRVITKDGLGHSMGTIYHALGLELGIKAGSSKYVCMCDPDLTFLNKWVDDLIPLTETYFFISNRWMPGQIFERSENKGKGEAVFMLMKRSNLEDNNLYPHYDYRSTAGNITRFAQQNKRKFLCLKNNFWKHSYCYRWGIPYEQMSPWRINKEYLKLEPFKDDYEEAFINGKAIIVHQVQHSIYGRDKNLLWTNLIKEYLDRNKAIFITTRTNSTRLPKKSLLKINDKETIVHLMERIKKSKKTDKIVLCTTQLKEDDVLCNLATENGIDYFRGSVTDKLERWRGACDKYNVDFFVTADGDDLLCEPELIDLAFEQYEKTNTDFIQGKDIICGSFTYGIKTTALEKVCQIKDTDDTEMMWVYFTDTGLFDVQNLENVPKEYKRTDIRMTLDYEDDFKFFKNIFENLAVDFNLKDVVYYIDKNPNVKDINYYLEEKWSQNQQQKTKLVLKNEE